MGRDVDDESQAEGTGVVMRRADEASKRRCRSSALLGNGRNQGRKGTE
jgi:hypothetical protein